MTDIKPLNVNRVFSQLVKELPHTLREYSEDVMTKSEAVALDPLVLTYIREDQDVVGQYALSTESARKALVSQIIEEMRSKYKTRTSDNQYPPPKTHSRHSRDQY